jgi:hypothetical protein
VSEVLLSVLSVHMKGNGHGSGWERETIGFECSRRETRGEVWSIYGQ